MYIEVYPEYYVEFFLQLTDKFIEVEYKNDISGIGGRKGKLSEEVWDRYDVENKMHRSSYLFQIRNRAHISGHYFHRRYIENKDKIEKFKIYAEAFTKAFHYIGYDFLKGSTEHNIVRKAELQYIHFKATLSNIKKDKKHAEDKLKSREEYMSGVYPEFLQNQKLGTNFVENDLPEIIDHLPHKSNYSHAIVFIDIDKLTLINDNYGRDVGDLILEEVSDILKVNVAFRYVGRCGDDTFYGVILYTNEHRTVQECENIRQKVQDNYWKAIAETLYVTCTIGVAIIKRDEDPFSWIQRAALGMRAGKERRGNLVELGPKFLSKVDTGSEIDTETSEGILDDPPMKKGKTKSQRKNDRQRKRMKDGFSLRTWFS